MKEINLLITGGTGFIGKNLIGFLKKRKKYKMSILSRQSIRNYECIHADLIDRGFIERILKDGKRIDVVIHLAYSKDYQDNLEITKNILEFCHKSKIKKIILLSSMSAKRSYPDDYGKNKAQIEKMVKNSGLNYTILRPSIIYGKGSTSFNFMIGYLKRIPFFVPVIGSGKYKISPVHIRDVINVIEKSIDNKKTDKKEYDIVGGEEVYFVDLINSLKKELKIKKRNFYAPLFFCDIIALFFPSIISKENIKNLTESSLADIESAKRDLEYKPIKFHDGVKNGII